MPCASPNYSCNSLISIRSPFGEVRLGASDWAAPGFRPIARFSRAFLVGSEWFARQRLRYAARELNQSLLDDIAASDPEAACEIRKLFGP
ncbi:MAG: hypothetical protein WD871_06575 [Xanthobacteraceae bacterium]